MLLLEGGKKEVLMCSRKEYLEKPTEEVEEIDTRRRRGKDLPEIVDLPAHYSMLTRRSTCQ